MKLFTNDKMIGKIKNCHKVFLIFCVPILIGISCNTAPVCDHEKNELQKAKNNEALVEKDWKTNADSCFWYAKEAVKLNPEGYSQLFEKFIEEQPGKGKIDSVNAYVIAGQISQANGNDDPIEIINMIRTGINAQGFYAKLPDAREDIKIKQKALEACELE